MADRCPDSPNGEHEFEKDGYCCWCRLNTLEDSAPITRGEMRALIKKLRQRAEWAKADVMPRAAAMFEVIADDIQNAIKD
jgi:hypothetical protein